jgi:hypothetical protein
MDHTYDQQRTPIQIAWINMKKTYIIKKWAEHLGSYFVREDSTVAKKVCENIIKIFAHQKTQLKPQ